MQFIKCLINKKIRKSTRGCGHVRFLQGSRAEYRDNIVETTVTLYNKTSKNLISETQLSRQITPRTKNGHAPPITQS